MKSTKVGTLRTLPSGSKIFSIRNQMNFITTEDNVVEVRNVTITNENWVFVKPKAVTFPGTIPGIRDNSPDEWSINYTDSVAFKMPKINPNIFS